MDHDSLDGPAGLTPQQRVALGQAFEMCARGLSCDEAAEHLVEHGMPKVVAKVLIKQYERRSNFGSAETVDRSSR